MLKSTEDDLRKAESMKRKNNLYQQVITVENLVLAEEHARKGKEDQYGVRLFMKDKDANILALHQVLAEKKFKTSEYSTFTIFEPKERLIFRLPYCPDRIVHWAVMNITESLFCKWFTADTYSCIKGKGIHAAGRSLRKALDKKTGTRYCLKLDVKKFYPSIDHQILKDILRRKIKDRDLLNLLDGIIDSAEGVPIGNYLSQYFANITLTPFDHWIKEEMRQQGYWRYADDMIFLSDSKEHLHILLREIRIYLKDNLKLELKSNYQIFPVESRGIDFVGYRFFHTHTLLRKSTKKRFARMLVYRPNKASINSYMGWASPKHCNSRNLLKKLLYGNISTDQTIQGSKNKAIAKSIGRKKDRNVQAIKSGNQNIGLPGKRIEVHGNMSSHSN